MCALVVKRGRLLSAKTRRAVCDEAKGTTGDYIASTLYHNYPDSKRWVDTISLINTHITDEQYRDLTESLGLTHDDAIFVSVRPETFTVILVFTELTIGRIYDARTSKTAFNTTSA
jgi:hypothetical protein